MKLLDRILGRRGPQPVDADPSDPELVRARRRLRELELRYKAATAAEGRGNGPAREHH